MRNYKKLGLYLLVVGLVLVGGFATSVLKIKAAADITITSAKITAPNEVTVIFNTGGNDLGTAPITAYGIADDGVGALTLASDVTPRNLSGVVITPTAFKAVYTFTGDPATIDDTGSLAVHAPDAILDTNTTPDSLDHSIVSIPLTDGQAPTLAASNIFVRNDVQPNKVTLTFSEPLEITAAQTVGNYIVTNGTIIYTIATAVLSPSNVVTLTLAPVDPADNKTFITNNDFRITQIRVTPNPAITDTATPANPYAGGLVIANVNGTYDGTSGTVNPTLVKNSDTSFTVSFSEKVNKTSAEGTLNYAFSGTCTTTGITPLSATLQTDGASVLLVSPDTSPCAGGQTVIVTTSSAIPDVAGTVMISGSATKILAATPLVQVTSAALSASGVASWDNLSNEDHFSVQLYKDATPLGAPVSITANTLTTDLLSAMRTAGAGVYTVTITAMGDGVTYSDGLESDPSSYQTIIQLATVSAGLTWTGDVAHWTAVSDGVSYDVQLYKGAPALGAPVNVSAAMIAGGVDFTSAIAEAGSGTYTYKVTAKGNATLILDALAASGASNENVYVAISKTALTAAITAEIGGTHGSPVYVLTEGDYTSGSWTTYSDAVAAAIVVEADGGAVQSEIDDATDLIGSTKVSLIEIIIPTLTTEDTATEITRTTATIGGAITDLGGENAFERGFKYGLTLDYENYTNETDSFGATEFSANLIDLKCDKTYHYQSYASNSAGTGYGSDQTFKTNGCASSGGGSLPTFTHTTPPVISLPILTSCPIYGSTHELVKEKTRGINAKGVQKAINQLKATTLLLATDGIIGPLSEAGIKNAQKILLVTPDVIWGPKTQQAYVLFIKKQCRTF